MTATHKTAAEWQREPQPAPSPPSPVAAVARMMIEKGLHLHPCYAARGGICTCAEGAACLSPGKHPILSRWQELATTDLEQIRAMGPPLSEFQTGALRPG